MGYKISELTAATAATADDLLVIVDAPGGSAATKKITVANFLANLPVTPVANLQALIRIAITSASVTGTIATLPAGTLLRDVFVVRTTAWDGAPTLDIGKVGTADWLTTNAQAALTTAVPAGEAAGVEQVIVNKYLAAETAIVATLNQGGATAGAGFILLAYASLT